MKLQLTENKVNQMLLVDAEPDHVLGSDFSLGFEPVFGEDKRSFAIYFDFEYITENRKYFRLDFHSYFSTDEDVDDDFKSSKFPVVNAPAIAFPFLRAFVANVLISGGILLSYCRV